MYHNHIWKTDKVVRRNKFEMDNGNLMLSLNKGEEKYSN